MRWWILRPLIYALKSVFNVSLCLQLQKMSRAEHHAELTIISKQGKHINQLFKFYNVPGGKFGNPRTWNPKYKGDFRQWDILKNYSKHNRNKKDVDTSRLCIMVIRWMWIRVFLQRLCLNAVGNGWVNVRWIPNRKVYHGSRFIFTTARGNSGLVGGTPIRQT